MIEELEKGPEAGADALGPAALLASIRSRKAAEDQAAADVARPRRPVGRPPPARVHPLRSHVHRRRGVSTRSPSPDRVRRWWRSSASPSSAPSWASPSVSAKKLIGHALELRHRLPRLWAQVHAGRVPAWRARAVAEATIHSSPALTVEAARFVDTQVAAVAGKIGPAQLDRLVAETIKRFDLAELDPAADPRTATSTSTRATSRSTTRTCTSPGPCGSRPRSTSPTGSTSSRPSPTAPPRQKALGSQESLDARRAKALGDLARTQTALDLHDSAGRHRRGSLGRAP